MVTSVPYHQVTDVGHQSESLPHKENPVVTEGAVGDKDGSSNYAYYPEAHWQQGLVALAGIKALLDEADCEYQLADCTPYYHPAGYEVVAEQIRHCRLGIPKEKH